ncbi:MAG: AAA family ATPase [Myxococcota bacterium]
MQDTQAFNPIVNPQGKMPVGISNFAQLVQGDYCFVDKSLFIKEILDAGDGVSLITRPRRFGKTINLNMLCCFLQQPAGEKEDLFDGLAISQQGTQYQRERGKRPVLFISLRTVKESNWDSAYIRMQSLLSKLAEEKSRDAPVNKLAETQQMTLQRVIRKQATPTESKEILAILTELLTLKHNGVTPWVCIDEYDAPMQSAYQYGYYKEMRNLMKGLLGDCLKDSPFLHRAVLTGILRVAKEDIFSDLNNPGIFGVLNHRFSSRFGFTKAQTQALLASRGLTESLQHEVRCWYDGYCFGHETIYNPWSVINYLANPDDQVQLYWVNTSTNHLVHKLLTRADATVKQGLHELLSEAAHYSTTQTVREHVPLREVENDSKNLWGLLLASGYLTAVQAKEDSNSDNKIVQLRIPNNEVRRVYSSLIEHWLQGAQGINGASLLDALVSGQLQEFIEGFQEFVLESASFFDTGGKQPERFYHAFVLGMLQHLRDRYIIDSEQISGMGRYDLALEPKDKTAPGFVFEFKRALQADDSLQASAAKALQQIQDKQYHVSLMKRGAQTIIALGFAFQGKKVAIAHTTLDGA